MNRTRRCMRLFFLLAVVAGWTSAGFGDAAAIPREGGRVPALGLNAPASQAGCDYLGISPGKPFQLTDIDSDLVMLEIIGVYCPQCHQQRPHINALYHRVQRDARLAKKIKFVGIAVGAAPLEVDHLVNSARIPYPIIADTDFTIHKQLGEPRTPFNLVIDRDGNVRWDHLGIIADMNAFYATLKSLADR